MSLEIQDLSVTIAGRRVVDGVSFSLPDGARLGLIGESGSGKSMTALAVLGLAPLAAEVTGSIKLNGRELVGLSDRELAGVRGKEVGIVFQEPATALNPVRRVGPQITEAIRIHYDVSKAEAAQRAITLAERVALPDPEQLVRAYPHQLSGGQRQRVAIAMAIATGPGLLIADEPTTALDVTIQAEILELFADLSRGSGTSLLFITHDLALLRSVVDDVVVLADGRVVEQASVDELITNPRTEITQQFVAAARATTWTRPAGDGDE